MTTMDSSDIEYDITCDDADREFTIEEIIPEEYRFVKVLGVGSFGNVVKCVKKKTGEEVAIKLRNSYMDYEEEALFLEKMMDAHLDRVHIVKFLEQIETPVGKGLVFECLDITLHNYMMKVFPIPLCDIRDIIRQMAVALESLEMFGYAHTDVKPDNIMIHGTDRPIQVKLIDFGMVMALNATEGMMTSIPMFRAPEVSLGCPFDAAMDVWSLGVSIANTMMNTILIPNRSEYEGIRAIVKLLGQPPDESLDQGFLTSNFFNKCGESWKLKTKKQYARENFLSEIPSHFTEAFPSLKSLIKVHYQIREEDIGELDSCIDLLEKMLNVNSATRIRAHDIRNHPFIKNYWENIPMEKSILLAQEEQEKEDTTTESMSSGELSIKPFTAEAVQLLLPKKYTVVSMQGVDNLSHQMVKCKRRDNRKVISVQIPFNGHDTFRETSLLKRMMRKGLEKRNIVQFFETIDFGTNKAMVFEELDTSLNYYFYQQRKIPILEARTITQQAATALAALEEMRLIHGNLTMDSFWFSDVRRNHTKIKLVDFSFAMYNNDIQEKMILSSHHRAPEVILGLPITEAVDVWSLGCILANMLLGFSIFPEGEFHTLKILVALFGQLPDDILNAGTKVTRFFKKTADSWRLMTDEEYSESVGMTPQHFNLYYTEKFKSLKCLVKTKVNGGMCGDLYHDDCVDILSKMFQVDAAKRIKPSQILLHRFFTEDCSDSEDEEINPRPPQRVYVVHPDYTPRVPCITELSRVEHELVPPETVQVFPDRIDNTLFTLDSTKDVTLDKCITLGHTVPSYGSGLSGEEIGTSKQQTSKSNNGGDKTQTTWSEGSQSESRSGDSKSQSAERSGKLENGNSDGNDHRVPLKSLLIKEEPEEEKKGKKKNYLRRVWSWVKKRFSCRNAVDDDYWKYNDT